MERKGRACRQAGFTLTELLVVVSILAIMAMIVVGILNPAALVNKGKDARRKKDLARIKVAFEEYYNDKGCYPDQTRIDELSSPVVCGSISVFAPWLTPWPCDPDGDPYEIVVEGADAGCPNAYRVYTTLDNTKDKDIPEGWGVTVRPHDTIDSPVNYGVSSPNTNWYEEGDTDTLECALISDGSCHFLEESCSGPGGCVWQTISSCSGDDCYLARNLLCKTSCCVDGVQCSP